MENLKDYTKKELIRELQDIDNLHDKIANATDGTNPFYSIQGFNDYELKLNTSTGSTIVVYDDIEYTIMEFIKLLQNKLNNSED